MPCRGGRPQLSGAVFAGTCPLVVSPLEGENDERAFDDLRAFVQRSFPPVNWGFTDKWLDSANALANDPCLPLMWKGLNGD